MARTIDPPNDNVDGGEPGSEGYTPPTGPNTKIASVVTKTAFAFTEDQIREAGGPWPVFTIKVTPVNDAGSGTPGEVEYDVEGGDTDYDGGDAGTEA